MAATASSLPHALHADIIVVDEPGRALLRRTDAVHRREELASTRELADAIIAFLAARNDNPRRYVRKAKGEHILRKSTPPDARAPPANQALFLRRHTTDTAIRPPAEAGLLAPTYHRTFIRPCSGLVVNSQVLCTWRERLQDEVDVPGPSRPCTDAGSRTGQEALLVVAQPCQWSKGPDRTAAAAGAHLASTTASRGLLRGPAGARLADGGHDADCWQS